MPTYAQLETEPYWLAEYEPEHFAAFLARLRKHYGHTRSQTGAKGDNNHLRGRHRSIAWCLGSRYCTDRSYGTRDQRDLRGDRNALRGFDLGVQGAELRAVSARVDAAVRAGDLPELAEWFGTKDGRTVVGWFEGEASSSNSSHLYHFHGGIWTEHVNNAAFLDRLFDVITGDDMPTVQEIKTAILGDGGVQQLLARVYTLSVQVPALQAEVVALRTAVEGIVGGDPDTAAILQGVDERLAAFRAQVEADTRDAVADLAEGGAEAVRADA